jgi:hypothetical protein
MDRCRVATKNINQIIMKKSLLLLTALLIGFFSQAQTVAEIAMESVRQSDIKEKAAKDAQAAKDAIFNHPNADFIMSLEKMNIEQVRNFADEIANSGKTKWEFLKITENEKIGYCRVKYIDPSVPADLKEKITKGSEVCEKCFEVNFVLYFEGENKDLEIKGVKQYRFREVTGKYLDLFSTWQRVFKTNATLETALSDYSLLELKHRAVGVNYWFRKNETTWTISNHSNYSKTAQ